MPLFEAANPDISFSRYLQEQLANSSIEIADDLSGKVIIHFWIDTAGNVVDYKIYRSINKSINSLACQIVFNSSKWTPGK
jgi:hypothetical protein